MIKLQDYETLYFQLFNKITDVIQELQDVQRQAEDAYICMNSKYEPEKPASPLLYYPKGRRVPVSRDRADCR
ncbi:MAG TPA: hypothetical protein VN366_13095 [Feifaniaceae bacterium]|nr:hypothetical protein [Feifaniaceae bacterium]